MDKIKLSAKDVEKLMAWRDNHKDLVRALPAPLKAVEVIAPSGISFKVFREDNHLTFHVFFNGKKLWKVQADTCMGLMVFRKSKHLNQELLQDINTTYASLMAYMVYGKREHIESTRHTAPHQIRHGSKKPSYTYVLRWAMSKRGTGHHASPQGEFTVRGHYRTYKSGKMVWIAPFKKGTGKTKDKTYKI